MNAHDPYSDLPAVASFTVTSETFADGQEVPPAQRSGGSRPRDVSPQLSWNGFPAGTKGFAVTMYDPDAPTASGFWHWAAFNIPASVTSLPAGAGSEDGTGLPAGAVQLKNDGGFPGFMGAAPPPGHHPHRYMLVVHAVDVAKLTIRAEATPAILGFNLFTHTLARARITGIYGR